DVLESFRQIVDGRGCVIRYGYMAYRWGDVSQRGDVASAAKPVYTHFLLKALEDGRIVSLDETVANVEPRLNEINKELGHKDRRIAWRHLANQTACYGVREEPGTAFDYNDWQMALFWDCLFQKVYGARGETIDEHLLKPMLAEVLQCEDQPTMAVFGASDRLGRMGLSVRDFARFGLLYLREGQWGDKQLVSREHARMVVSGPLPATLPRTTGLQAEMIAGARTVGSNRIPDDQSDHFGSYSWLWWVNGIDRNGVRMWPDAPADMYCASGHSGQRVLAVIPSLDLVVSYNTGTIKEWTNGAEAPFNQAMKCLVAAIK
ncbi:MAG TPA: hypothetical protein VHP11_12470, partial [Tepidisphaeraceae bacterium]|nr:hypothetical protein [Tepidisphaeraceae bacterium]